jgi:DNA-binding FadR family transcriptional regulator
MTKPLRRPVLSEAIRDYLRQYIVDHNLNPGDPLPPEAQLAQEMGVGRGSVREAIKSLQSLGVVEVRHGEGLYVRAFSFAPMIETVKYGMRFNAKSLSELAQIRYFLERAAIEEAVQRIGEDDIERMEELIQTWEARVQNGEGHGDLDEQFHRILHGCLDNHMFVQLFELFWVAFQGLGDQGRSPEEDLRNHREILDAVKAHDLEAARGFLADHYEHLLQKRIRQPRES